MIKKWTDEELAQAVATSTSLLQVTEKLKLARSGNTHQLVRQHIRRLGLDTSHWVCVAWRARHGFQKIILSPDEVLVDPCPCGSAYVRRLVKRERIFPYCCAKCGLTEWQGEPITLQLDHINGVHSDCRRENLRWLCPNCHSQTSTWGAKQRRRRCQDCGRQVTRKSTYCLRCANARKKHDSQTRIQWPSLDELCVLLASQSYVAVAKQLGVTDSAIRKRLRKRGIDPKTLGFRAKKTPMPLASAPSNAHSTVDVSLTTE